MQHKVPKVLGAAVVLLGVAGGLVWWHGSGGSSGRREASHPAVAHQVTARTTIPPTPTTVGVNPLHDWDFAKPVATYRTSITAGIAALVTDVDQLAGLVRSRDLGGARAQWLVGHQEYARLGAAYDAFGDYDGDIDGRPAGLAKGVADPAFTGFLAIERRLWAPAPDWAALGRLADGLDHDARSLQHDFPGMFIDAPDLPLRAHEILENALQFELTGKTDEGSHTNLATVRANVDGTRLVLAALRPLLAARGPRLLATIDADLDRLATEVDRHRHATSWDPLDSLDRSDRERLDGDLSAALEHLALVPPLLPVALS